MLSKSYFAQTVLMNVLQMIKNCYRNQHWNKQNENDINCINKNQAN